MIKDNKNTRISYNDLTFYGKKITDLTRNELYLGIEWLYNINKGYREMIYDSDKSTLDLMNDLIDNKKSL